MYLKSLELQGFKSFPDKVTLSFDKGVTAVVGPNGSGKSNISDAVRWVLGEQSSKTLRGSKMEDVIFSGTQKRKQMGFALVTLNIDNSEGTVPEIGKEISVTRRYYRSGDSEYILNGKHVRLKDIHELFMDTGLGRDGYSMIGQGRVSEIVGVKSEERRAIFEEAAGVSKFRYKKEDAERKLVAAEDNLVRIQDIISELEGRIEPLRKQSEKAKQYVLLAEQQKKREISLWDIQLDEINEKQDEISTQLLESEARLENVIREISEQETDINEGYAKLQKLDVEIEDTRREYNNSVKKTSELKSEAAVLENEIKHRESEKERIYQLIENQNKNIEEIKSREEKRKADMKILLEKKSEAEKKCSETDVKISEINRKIADLNKKSDEEKETLMKLYAKQSALREKCRTLEISVSAEINEEETEAEKNLKNEYSERNKEFSECSKALKENEKSMEETDEAIERTESELAKLKAENSELAQQFNKFASQMQTYRQRFDILSDMEKNMEGFAGSVKAVLRANSNGKIGGIYGTVAQILAVDSKYGLAIETALGGSMQNIVVDDENSAKNAIAFLKNTHAGRATFLPVTSVRGRVTENNLSDEAGFIGNAWKLVSYDAKYTGIVQSLLGRIVIVDNIDNAADIAKKYRYSFKIVTLDGQVINSGGSFTGGSAQRSGGMLTRHSEIEKLSEYLKKADAKYSVMSEKLESVGRNFSVKEEALSEQKSLKVWIETERIKIESRRQQAEFALEQINQRIAENENLKAEKIKQQETDRKTLEESKLELEKTELELADIQKKSSSGKDENEKLNAEKDEFIQKKSEYQIEFAGIERDINLLNREAESDRILSETGSTRNTELLNQAENNKKLIEESKQKMKSDAEEAEKLAVLSEKLGEKNEELRTKRDSQSVFIRQLQDGMRENTSAREKFAAETLRLEERKKSLINEFDRIINRLLEDYELTRSEAKQFAEPVEDVLQLKKEIQELKNQIRKLGNVNVDSIEEYREVSERYGFYSKQIKDINSSKRELENLIVKLTSEMSQVFEESFAKINQNFKEIFVELFGGGKAELRLTDPEHVLESGIEIIVAPPGKVIKNLISLSGGEQSFIAIAIYFAILRLRPSPFCILDEIDAALDEANVRKYARYLKNFTDTTQFILVTHRRGAMEEAGVLYGVTMQEDGISKLLRLDQREALEQAENN